MSEKSERQSGIGLDVGTAFCACCSKDIDGQEIYQILRDCFLKIEASEEAKVMLEQSKANFIESSDGTSIYVIGGDALKFANIMEGVRRSSRNEKALLRRPMAGGVLNPDEPDLAFSIMRQILKNLLGTPKEKGEVVCFSVPGNPVDANFNTMYHEKMIEGIIQKLGFSPKSINEGLAVIYSTNPTIETEDGEEVPFSGVGISMGGGMINVCFAYRSYPLVEFSIANAYGMNEGSGGDWIDLQVSKTRADLSISKVTALKEKYADFTIDPFELSTRKEVSGGKKAVERRNYEILMALDMFYRRLISYALKTLGSEFAKQGESVEEAVEIVIAGGTSSPNGMEELVMQEIEKLDLPFEVKGVRKAEDPLYTVSNGCLVSALTQR